MSLSILLTVAGAILVLVVAAGAVVLRDPEASKRRVEALFRRAPKPPRSPDAKHYYRPYWS